VENNLIYRVSGIGVYTPRGPAGLNQANTIRNNLVAFARTAITAVNDPYKNPAFTTIPQSFVYSNNLFNFDRAIELQPEISPRRRMRLFRRLSVHAVSVVEEQFVLAHGRRFRKRRQGVRSANKRGHRRASPLWQLE